VCVLSRAPARCSEPGRRYLGCFGSCEVCKDKSISAKKVFHHCTEAHGVTTTGSGVTLNAATAAVLKKAEVIGATDDWWSLCQQRGASALASWKDAGSADTVMLR